MKFLGELCKTCQKVLDLAGYSELVENTKRRREPWELGFFVPTNPVVLLQGIRYSSEVWITASLSH
jgi:hypothetical protein